MKKILIPIIIIAVIIVGFLGYSQMNFSFVDWKQGGLAQMVQHWKQTIIHRLFQAIYLIVTMETYKHLYNMMLLMKFM